MICMISFGVNFYWLMYIISNFFMSDKFSKFIWKCLVIFEVYIV